MERELKLCIVLEKPTAGVDFGLQSGRGSDYETIQKQRSKGKDLHFEFTVRVKDRSGKAAPTFLGTLVQGPPTERFIYIDIGTYAGQSDTPWSRRLKIPLVGVSWEMIERASANSHAAIETSVPGTGRDGGPNCGGLKASQVEWELRLSKSK
jgi:hypothetical protein